MTQLTPHFSLAEMTVTTTGLDNTPTQAGMAALLITAHGMENVRRIVGDRPCLVTSGYRSPAVNRAVGGVPDSDHALGYACDFHIPGLAAIVAARLIAESSLVFDQLILERHASLIHISFNPRLRRQILNQPLGPGTTFFQGLE
jgi:putative chitinase